MSNMIECGTCGYPLTPEERTNLVEYNGRMVKPWQGLTDEERAEFDNWALNGAMGFVYAIEAKLKEKNDK